MLKKILAVATLIGLTACSSSKQADNAKSLATEHNELATWLLNTTPDSSWNTPELDAFEGKINRLVQIKAQLRRMDGRNGISVTGGHTEGLIAQKRVELASARYYKANPNGTFNPYSDPQNPAPRRRRYGDLGDGATVQSTNVILDETGQRGADDLGTRNDDDEFGDPVGA